MLNIKFFRRRSRGNSDSMNGVEDGGESARHYDNEASDGVLVQLQSRSEL